MPKLSVRAVVIRCGVARLALGGILCFLSVMTAVSSLLAGNGSVATQNAVGTPQLVIAPSVASARALINNYCVGCHNQRARTAGLMLDALDLEHVAANAETWEKVVRKLRTRAMPPAGLPRPDKATALTFVSWLETSLDHAAMVAPNPGRPAIHRLNRVEYTNAIRDLLNVQIDGTAFLPGDDSGYGFDNIADILSFSPGLLERYMLAAHKIGQLAIGETTIVPSTETYNFSLFDPQEYRLSDDFPAGSRGGVAIRHYFPADGKYVLKIHLQRERGAMAGIRGLDEPSAVDVRLDGERLVVFGIGGKVGAGYSQEERIRRLSGDLVDKSDEGLLVRFTAKAGPRLIGVTFNEKTWVTEGIGPSRLPPMSTSFSAAVNTNDEVGKIEAGVDSVDIEGPFDAKTPKDTPARHRIMVCHPTGSQDEMSCAQTILLRIARHAYRRPVTVEDVQPLLAFFKKGQSRGGFEAGIQRALEAILVDPEFLFRIEHEPANVLRGTVFRINDLDFASRLSFFLWSSIPDDELLNLAVRGTLRDSTMLEQQIRRMLRDARSNALINSFFGQWLGVRDISNVKPDPKAFPEFDADLRAAFRRETELFLESQLREDRSVLDVLTADYTFLNERLARHYGIPGVYGSHFRRVAFGDDRRAGVLGHGSVLTITSYANRTSPVVRGKWVLENLLGTPPPPPPPDVPPFPENQGEAPRSVRERMEQHRKNPVCATCHSRLDPLGFAFENFDGIGRWRTTDANSPVDPSGAFPDGGRFDGPAAFRKLLLQQGDPFVMTLTEKLLTYALGRGVEYYDMPVIREIAQKVRRNDDRWSSLILNIVKSVPFQMKRVES